MDRLAVADLVGCGVSGGQQRPVALLSRDCAASLYPPTGLAGWTWGILDLDAVPVRPEDVLHGDGMVLLRRHFAGYRPLVTATALGGAAMVFDTVTAVLPARQAAGDLERLRDSALVTIGRAHAQLVTALLGAIVASSLADAECERAEWVGRRDESPQHRRGQPNGH